MALKDRTTSERNAKLSENFRMVAGLPKRKNNKPSDPSDTSEVTLATEPDGGYGGKDGIKNTGAVNSTEERARLERDKREAKRSETLVKEKEKAEEDAAKSGQGNTTPGGEDAKTGPTVGAHKKTAKKTAAKK